MAAENIIIDRRSLYNSLEEKLSLEDVRRLYFFLRDDHEDPPLGGKSALIRELIVRCERSGRTEELMTIVREDYQIVAKSINVQEMLESAAEADEIATGDVRRLMAALKRNTETLNEWKELHNHLDELSRNFGPCATHVERLAAAETAVDNGVVGVLQALWQPTNERIELLLWWAKEEIEYIGERYQQLPSPEESIGVAWAVDLAKLQKAIERMLDEAGSTTAERPVNPSGLGRILKGFGSGNEDSALWQTWWEDLSELARQLDDAIRHHMFVANKKLRQSATELHDLSKEALWRDG